MRNTNIITNKAEINAILDKTGREFRIPTCPEPIKIENPHAVIEIKEKPFHEPTAQELMEMIQHDKIGKIHVGEYQSEREALTAIYEAANGKRWHNNTNWCKDDKPVSEWYGVTVSPEYVFFHEGKIKKLMGHVTRLDLSHNNIYCGKLEDNGRISPRIKDLTKLQFLNLGYNFIHGRIPDEVYSLKDLEELYIHFNQLEGGISAKISQLKKLRRLQFDHNHLTGPIPVEIGSLTNLEWLCLHFNDLDNGYTLIRSPKKPGVTLQRKSVNIPASFAKLTKLENFMVYMNQLSGTIPAALKKHPNYSKWQINPQQDKVNLK